MADPLMVPEATGDHPWIVSLDINKLLAEQEATTKTTRRQYPSVYRVPPFIRYLKPEIYNASFLPTGLYNRDFQKVTAVDTLKLEVLTCILAQLKVNQDNWQTFCKEVATQPPDALTPDVEYFYEADGSFSSLTLEAKQSILVIDAFFIVALFIWRLEPEDEEEGKWVSDDRPRFIRHIMQIFYRGSVESSIHAFDRDICWLFEAQIPLFMIRNVWEKIVDSGAEIDEFDTALRQNLGRTLMNSGFVYKDPSEDDINFDTCDHLLECVHRSLSHWTKGDDEDSDEDDNEEENDGEEENEDEDDNEEENDGEEEKEEFEERRKDSENPEDEKLKGDLDLEGKGGEQKDKDEEEANEEVEKSEDKNDDNEEDDVDDNKGDNEENDEKEGFTSRLRNRIEAVKDGIVSLYLQVFYFLTGLLGPSDAETRYTLPSAVELSKMGIRLKGVGGSFNDVHFQKSLFHLSATLQIPKMDVADFTEKMLLNMCVYESMTRKADGVHDYLLLMDELIDSKEDVDLLMEGQNPVITANGLGDNQRVAQIFSNPVQNFHFSSDTDERIEKAREAILAWYNEPWRRQVVEFIDRFRLQPWLLVSLFAATFLLVLTVLQTIYTIWGFYKA